MIQCRHCESIIPKYYHNCSVCGQTLDLKYAITFKTQNKNNSIQNTQIAHIERTIEYGEINDFYTVDQN